LRAAHQIGNYADLCNDCGNCDVFCPEDGGPYQLKPRFFGSEQAWLEDRPRDGFHMARVARCDTVLGRFAGREYRLEVDGDHARFMGAGFALTFERAAPVATLDGEAQGEVDLAYFEIMDGLRRALLAGQEVAEAAHRPPVGWIGCMQP
jgi:putative selenate reductase